MNTFVSASACVQIVSCTFRLMSLFGPSATLWARVTTTGCQTAHADKDHLLCSPVTQTSTWNTPSSTKPKASFMLPKKQICKLEPIRTAALVLPCIVYLSADVEQHNAVHLSVGGTKSRWVQMNPRMSGICPPPSVSLWFPSSPHPTHRSLLTKFSWKSFFTRRKSFVVVCWFCLMWLAVQLRNLHWPVQRTGELQHQRQIKAQGLKVSKRFVISHVYVICPRC